VKPSKLINKIKRAASGDIGDSSGGEGPTKTSESPESPTAHIKQRINKILPKGENKTVEDPMINLQRKLLEQKKKDREIERQIRRGSEDEYLSDEYRPLSIKKKQPGSKIIGSSPSPLIDNVNIHRGAAEIYAAEISKDEPQVPTYG
jgi:hypothetical protein